MNRTEKIKILSRVLTGETAALRLFRNQSPKPVDYHTLSDKQLLDIIRAGMAIPYPDNYVLTDEELEAIINSGKP